jgi:hypothetical protein
MTLLDIRNQIISKLCTKNVLSTADFDDIQVVKELEDAKEELVRAALAEIEATTLIKRIGGSMGDMWILTHPLNSSGHQVGISMNVADAIAEVINSFLKAHELDEDRCDSLNITERDIVQLLNIVSFLLSDDPDTEEEEDRP